MGFFGCRDLSKMLRGFHMNHGTPPAKMFVIYLDVVVLENYGIKNYSLISQRPVRLAYKLYFFSQRIIFFSHNKSANNIFSYGLSAKRTAHCKTTV